MMRRGTSVTLIVVLLFLLALSAFVQLWFLPSGVRDVVAVFPEVQRIAVPSVVWGVLAIACWQIAGVIGLHLVRLARRHELEASAIVWLRTMIGCLVLFIMLVMAALILLNVLAYTTPGVMFVLIGGGLLAMIGATSLAIFLGSRPWTGRYSHV